MAALFITLEEKGRILLFLLLVTLSSVKAVDFAFSKSAYAAIESAERLIFGKTLTDTTDIIFLRTEYEEKLIQEPTENLGEGAPRGLHLVLKDDVIADAAMFNMENQTEDLEYLIQMSIIFRKIKHLTGVTTFGNLLIWFHDGEENTEPSYMTIYMFSAPRTADDEAAAKKIAKKLNPLSQVQVTSILAGESFLWTLSSLEKVLYDDIKKIDHVEKKTRTGYSLQPIIVDAKLLEQYLMLANPNGDVEEVTDKKGVITPVQYLQRREIGDRSRRRGRGGPTSIRGKGKSLVSSKRKWQS